MIFYIFCFCVFLIGFFELLKNIGLAEISPAKKPKSSSRKSKSTKNTAAVLLSIESASIDGESPPDYFDVADVNVVGLNFAKLII